MSFIRLPDPGPVRVSYHAKEMVVIIHGAEVLNER
jgi:hypothetical protein